MPIPTPRPNPQNFPFTFEDVITGRQPLGNLFTPPAQAGRGTNFKPNYFIPIPRTNPVSDVSIYGAGPQQHLGINPLLPVDYTQQQQALGQPGPMPLNAFAKQVVQSHVPNPAQRMYGALPTLNQQAGPERPAMMDLGSRRQAEGQERNLQAMNRFLTTKPLEKQLERSTLAAQVGVANADLLRQMEKMWADYGFAKQQQEFAKKQAGWSLASMFMGRRAG